jgi:hypothetical protein
MDGPASLKKGRENFPEVNGRRKEVAMEPEVQILQPERSDLPEAEALRVKGRVEYPLILSMKDLCEMETEQVEDVLLICGSGTPKGRIASCRGILLDEVIRRAPVIKAEHNDTKKMFIVAAGGDGHKVVFSWQEIFNTLVGGGVMILIERDGKSLCAEGRLDLISTEDYHTGSRYVRGLKSIEVILA